MTWRLLLCLIGKHDMEATTTGPFKYGKEWLCWETRACTRCVIWGHTYLREVKR